MTLCLVVFLKRVVVCVGRDGTQLRPVANLGRIIAPWAVAHDVRRGVAASWRRLRGHDDISQEWWRRHGNGHRAEERARSGARVERTGWSDRSPHGQPLAADQGALRVPTGHRWSDGQHEFGLQVCGPAYHHVAEGYSAEGA